MATYQYNILLIPESKAMRKMRYPFDEDFEFWEYNWWNKTLSFDTIKPELKQNLPDIEWAKEYSNLHQYGNNDTNDVSISLIDEEFIDNIHVRIDLREIDRNFLELVMKIASGNQCLLLDRQGNIFNPSIEKLKESI